MSLKRKINPIVLFFMMLLLIICCSIGAFYIANSDKYDIGTPEPRFLIAGIYQTEPWTFEVENYSLSLPDKSLIATVYRNDQLIGIVVQSEGGYLEDKNTRQRRTLDNFFLPLNSEKYTKIKGDTLFLPLENQSMQMRVTASARPLIQLPEVQGIIFSRLFLPAPGVTCIYLEGGETIPSSCSVILNKLPLFLFFGLVALSVMLTTYLLTMDLDPGSRINRLFTTKPAFKERLVAVLILLVIIVAGLQGKLHIFAAAAIRFDTIIIYFIIICLLLVLSRKQLITPQEFGLASGWQSYFRGIVIVPVILLIIILFSTLQFPTSLFIPDTPKILFLQFLLIFSYAFGVEFFWRGFLQTFLERLWGKGFGLILTTVLFIIPPFLDAYNNAGLPLPTEKAMEVLFFFPITALILGYFYQRSHNLLSVTLLHALILFLPRIMFF